MVSFVQLRLQRLLHVLTHHTLLQSISLNCRNHRAYQPAVFSTLLLSPAQVASKRPPPERAKHLSKFWNYSEYALNKKKLKINLWKLARGPISIFGGQRMAEITNGWSGYEGQL